MRKFTVHQTLKTTIPKTPANKEEFLRNFKALLFANLKQFKNLQSIETSLEYKNDLATALNKFVGLAKSNGVSDLIFLRQSIVKNLFQEFWPHYSRFQTPKIRQERKTIENIIDLSLEQIFEVPIAVQKLDIASPAMRNQVSEIERCLYIKVFSMQVQALARSLCGAMKQKNQSFNTVKITTLKKLHDLVGQAYLNQLTTEKIISMLEISLKIDYSEDLLTDEEARSITSFLSYYFLLETQQRDSIFAIEPKATACSQPQIPNLIESQLLCKEPSLEEIESTLLEFDNMLVLESAEFLVPLGETFLLNGSETTRL